MTEKTNGYNVNAGEIFYLKIDFMFYIFECLLDKDPRWEEVEVPVPWGHISGEF